MAIKPKSQRVDRAPVHSSAGNHSQVLKDNENLRKRVNDLEMECFNLSYKNSEIVGGGNGQDAYQLRQNDDPLR